MAEQEEAEVDYYAVLNVRNEVKIVFQIETNREILNQSCKVYFIAFQVNQNELKAACRVPQTRVHVISRSRENEGKVEKNLGPVGTKQNFLCFAKKFLTGSHF